MGSNGVAPLRKFNSAYLVPVALLLIASALAYLPNLLQATVYRDDWYYVLDRMIGGPGVFQAMFSIDRPARGPFFELYYLLFGVHPLPYHLASYVWRFLSGLAAGDFVIARADGIAAYQLAVVVDDAAMGITEVVRGDDLLPSTARQLLLYQALAATPPSFAHVPLVVGPDGERLAKRHGAPSIGELRERGADPRVVVGLLAELSGLAPRGRAVAIQDLVGTFRLDAVSRNPVLVPDIH